MRELPGSIKAKIKYSDEIMRFIFDGKESKYIPYTKKKGFSRKEIVDVYLDCLFEKKVDGRHEQVEIEGVLYKEGWREAFRSFLQKEGISKEEIQERASYFIKRCKLDEPGFYFDKYSGKILEEFVNKL